MEKILVSACLLGDKCRYDGGDNFFPFLEKLQKHYELVAFCPEMAANLGCPRPKAEIKKDKVVTEDGTDLTAAYRLSAEQAVRLCDFLGIRIAILKDKSPACGSRYIHNGMFMGNTIEGLGVTAAALIKAGVKVYAETDALDFLLPKEEEKKGNDGRYKHYEKKDASLKEKKKPYNKNKQYIKKDKSDSKKKPYKKDNYSGFNKDEGKAKGKKPYSKPRLEKDGKKPSFHKSQEGKLCPKKKEGNSYHKERSFSRNKAKRNGSEPFKKSHSSRKPYARKADKGNK